MSNPYEVSQQTHADWTPPPSATRPQSPMVIGILNILWGIWNLCGVGAGVFGLIAMASLQNGNANLGPNPGLAAMQNPVYFGWTVFTLVVSFVAVIMMIASGVGLIQYRMWGRNWSAIWATMILVQTVLGLVVAAIFVWIPLYSQMQAAQNGNPQATAGLIGGMVGGVCGMVIGLAYPSVVLYFTRRDDFKAALS